MEFTDADRSQLFTYLNKSKFKLLDYLRSNIRKVTATSFEEVSLEAKYKQGQEDLLEQIAILAMPQRTPEATSESFDTSTGIV